MSSTTTNTSVFCPERALSFRRHGAVHHCHHYNWGADCCTDGQWTDPTAGELSKFTPFNALVVKCANTALMTTSMVRFTDFRFQSVDRPPPTGLHLTSVCC